MFLLIKTNTIMKNQDDYLRMVLIYLKMMDHAFQELVRVWNMDSDHDIDLNDYLQDFYPFPASLDEFALDVREWVRQFSIVALGQEPDLAPPPPPSWKNPSLGDEEPYQIICSYCGGTHVVFDANASWCAETQEEVLDSSFDNCDCIDCGAECHTEQVPYTPGQIYPVYFKVEKDGKEFIVKAEGRDEVEDRFKVGWGDVYTIDRNKTSELSVDFDLTNSDKRQITI
jgi:hypothetical protein